MDDHAATKANSAFLHLHHSDQNGNADNVEEPQSGNNWTDPAASNTVYFELDKTKLNNGENDDNIEKEEREGVRSMVSTVLTADGIADKTSFQITLLVIFLGDMARGIFFPTMWNLVQALGGDQVTLGYVVASFSFGRMLVLPLFGTWSMTYGYRWTLLVSTSILFFGTVLFGQALNMKEEWFVVLANIVIGIGSGTLGVTLAYVSEVTPKRKRTGYIAWATCVQYAGTTITPIIGSVFVYWLSLGEGDVINYDGFPAINEFTAPAIFMSVFSLMTLFLIYFYFEDRPRAPKPAKTKKSSRQMAYDEVANGRACFGFFNIYNVCLYGCMALNAGTKGPMSCFETLGIDFAESRFLMNRAEAGVIVASMGLIGACLLMAMGYLSEKFDDTQLTIGGIIFFLVGIIMNTTLDREDRENNSKWRYVVAMFFTYSIGYPICHTALIGLFSKIVGRKPQGALQGWFSSSGSVARITFPVLAGYIVMGKDIETLFYIITVTLVAAIIFLVAFREPLVRLAA